MFLETCKRESLRQSMLPKTNQELKQQKSHTFSLTSLHLHSDQLPVISSFKSDCL